MFLSALFSENAMYILQGYLYMMYKTFTVEQWNIYQDMSSSEYESDIFMVNPSAKYNFYFNYFVILVCFPVTLGTSQQLRHAGNQCLEMRT